MTLHKRNIHKQTIENQAKKQASTQTKHKQTNNREAKKQTNTQTNKQTNTQKIQCK